MIYLDHAAATPIRKEVMDVIQPYFSESYGNPSSLHDLGIQANLAMEDARDKIKKLLNVDKVIFTGSATESINLAFLGIFKQGDHLITTKIEHKAVLNTAKYLEKQGVNVTYLPVNKQGLISLQELENAITKHTRMISIQYVNNEIGTIQPLKKIANIANKFGILLHTDACQAGFLDLDLPADLVTLNAAKIYGPKGIGLLGIKGDIHLRPLIFGGDQEDGIRSGTENIPLIVGFAKAIELAQKEKIKYQQKLTELRDYFIKALKDNIRGTQLNGHAKKRVANNISINLGCQSETVLKYLDKAGIYAASGSACTSNSIQLSHVLHAIGHHDDPGAIRFTLGKDTTKKQLIRTVKELTKIVGVLRAL
jgi:cysteine desulfurase